MSSLQLDQLVAGYGRTAVVHGIALALERGELVSLLGPSGCGKTTTMRAVAGLLPARYGRILLDGEDITRRPAHQREIGLVFQSYALFPHLSAFENVAFGLRLRRVGAAELQQRVRDGLAAVGLGGFEERLPAALSGGQQQRVALARSIVLRPRLLLLDEPLSNLDARLRLEMRAELRRIQRELGLTMLYVTHDQEEALALSDRIVVMNAGRIEQDAAPEAVYHRPATPFVAAFMGCENLFEWRDGALHGRGARFELALPRPATHVAWRPSRVRVQAGAAGAAGALSGRVLARSYLGDSVESLVDTPIGPVKGIGDDVREGETASVWLDPAQAALIG